MRNWRKTFSWQVVFEAGIKVRVAESAPVEDRTFSSDDGEDVVVPVGEVGYVSEDTDPEFDGVSVILPNMRELLGSVPLVMYRQDLEIID